MEEKLSKKILTPEAKKVLFEKGTEAPFSGEYVDTVEDGMYKCANCGTELFSSNTKLDSRSGPAGLQGWPAFEDAIPGAVKFVDDNSLGMHRTEVTCAKCEAHLGHLFDDEGTSTKKHYCINSVCLDLDKKLNNEK